MLLHRLLLKAYLQIYFYLDSKKKNSDTEIY